MIFRWEGQLQAYFTISSSTEGSNKGKEDRFSPDTGRTGPPPSERTPLDDATVGLCLVVRLMTGRAK